MTNHSDLYRYGVEDVNAYFENAKDSITYKLAGGHLLVANLLSDAQELILLKCNEQARQTINLAKFLQNKIVAGELNFINSREAAL